MSKYSVNIEKVAEAGDLEVIVLKGNGQEARLIPAKGGNLCSYIVDGQELLQAPADLASGRGGFGFPVMFPYANRIVDATFTFEGTKYTIIKNGQPKVLHGVVQDEAFAYSDLYADDDKASATVSIEIKPGTLLYTIYPFYLKLSLTYSISNDGLKQDWCVENLGTGNAPFGYGVHTYFGKIDDIEKTFLKVPTNTLMETDNCYPTRKKLDVQGTTYDLTEFVELGKLNLDNLYGDMSSKVICEIEYRGVGRKTFLQASDNMKYMIVFSPPRNANGFCLENQTNCTDGFNILQEGKPRMANVIVLPAGGKETGWINVRHAYINK